MRSDSITTASAILVAGLLTCGSALAGDGPEARAKKLMEQEVEMSGKYRKIGRLAADALDDTGVPWIRHVAEPTDGRLLSFGHTLSFPRSAIFATLTGILGARGKLLKGVMILVKKDAKLEAVVREPAFRALLARKLLDTCHASADAREREALLLLARHLLSEAKDRVATEKQLGYCWLAPSVLGTAADQRVRARPLSEAEATRVGALIEQLGDAKFATREAATAALKAFGQRVEARLAAAAAKGSPEKRARVKALLELLSRPVPFALVVLRVKAVEGDVVELETLTGPALSAGRRVAMDTSGAKPASVTLEWKADGKVEGIEGKVATGARLVMLVPK